jgi:DNA-binding transcriptional regulator YhcF (GntR family)
MNQQAATGGPRRASIRDIEQIIVSRIARGEYARGSRLPTCERLGMELGANKNTVSKAYQALALKGYTVSTPGRGTFVGKRPTQALGDDRSAEVTKLLGDAIAQARLFGLSADELEALAVKTIRQQFDRTGVRVGYVDCNRLDSRKLARELSVALLTQVEPLIVTDVPTAPGAAGDGYDLLAVHVAHIRAVERRLRRAGGIGSTAVVPVVALPGSESLTQVARLPEGTRLLVISDTEEVLHALFGLSRSVNPSSHVSALLSSSSHVEDALAGADAVLVTRTAQRRLGSALAGSNTIVASFRIEEQSVVLLAERLAAIRHAGPAAGSQQPRSPDQPPAAVAAPAE